ncbi:hypothetical protein [Bremerella sp. P1]|uniref:hypothetical protein n=1 Tax=Bremerella sp. P1 TaxID=3026424 RepID=UPI0023686B5E|nr:hypothetical protein [Bremerella sp. P1]WDI42122.1 hypothetical protein PSR63_27085 [Bremerella sp. P1]
MSLTAKQRSRYAIVKEPVPFVVHPWNLTVTEKEVILTPMAVPWRGIGVFCGLFIIFCGVMAVPVVLWGEPDQRWWVVLFFSLFAIFICTLITTVIYYSYRSAQSDGPPLLIDRVERIVHVPKFNLSVPFDEVDHLQVRNDMPDEEEFSLENNVSELVLVLRDESQRNWYPLLICYSCDYYDKLAKELAALNLMPIKRVKGVPGSKLVYEKWLTPEPDRGAETSEAPS